MKLHRPGWRGIVLSSAVVAASAAITFGATLLFGMPFGGDDATPAGAHVSGTRDRLTICVDVYDPGGGLGSGPAVQAIQDRAQAAIRDGLVRVKQHPLWEKTGLQAKGEPEVDVGCPSPPLLSLEGVGWRAGGPAGGQVHPVQEAEISPYALFVFVAPRDEIDTLLGRDIDGTIMPNYARQVGQEYVCSGDVCFPETDAIYLTDEELADATFVTEKLEEFLGMRRPQ